MAAQYGRGTITEVPGSNSTGNEIPSVPGIVSVSNDAAMYIASSGSQMKIIFVQSSERYDLNPTLYLYDGHNRLHWVASVEIPIP